MDLELAGHRALVTIGNSGIGFSIAEALVREEAAVGICSRDRSNLNGAVIALGRGGGTAIGVAAAVSLPAQIGRAVDQVAERLGGLDLLVTCVGGDVGPPWLLESRSADWAATFQLNVGHSVDALRPVTSPDNLTGHMS